MILEEVREVCHIKIRKFNGHFGFTRTAVNFFSERGIEETDTTVVSCSIRKIVNDRTV